MGMEIMLAFVYHQNLKNSQVNGRAVGTCGFTEVDCLIEGLQWKSRAILKAL